jgi:hypothetical protein
MTFDKFDSLGRLRRAGRQRQRMPKPLAGRVFARPAGALGPSSSRSLADQLYQPLGVVAHALHGDRQVVLGQRHRPDHLAAELVQRGKHMLNPCSRAVDRTGARVQSLARQLPWLGTPRDAVAQSAAAQQFTVGLRVMAPIGQQPVLRVGIVDHRLQGQAIVHIGRRDRNLADQLPARVHVALHLVPIEALAVLLGPASAPVGVLQPLGTPSFWRLVAVQGLAFVAVGLGDRALHDAGYVFSHPQPPGLSRPTQHCDVG